MHLIVKCQLFYAITVFGGGVIPGIDHALCVWLVLVIPFWTKHMNVSIDVCFFVRSNSHGAGLFPTGFVLFVFYGEFDPGSGRTLAACLTHASRTMKPSLLGGRVANG